MTFHFSEYPFANGELTCVRTFTASDLETTNNRAKRDTQNNGDVVLLSYRESFSVTKYYCAVSIMMCLEFTVT